MLRLAASPLAAFVVAFLGRVAVILAIGHYRNPALWENGVIAQYLADGCGFCMDFSRPGEPSSWQAPAYPALLFGAWSVFGRGARAHLALSLLQALALASMVFPMRALARRWFGHRVAVFAMWITCVMPLYMWYATRLHQAGLVMAFHPWLVWAWLRAGDRPTLARTVAAVALSGVAGLFQPILVFLGGAIGLALLVRALRGRDGLGAWRLVAGAAATVLVLLPWTVRNYAVHGRFVPIRDSFGKEFWMGNNPHATGTGYAAGGTTEITYAFPPRAFARRGRLPEADLMAAMAAEAVEYIRAEPGAFVSRTAKKVLWFWTIAPRDLVRASQGG